MTILGGINKQAVAPAMNNMAASLDTQLNDPNAYYNMPDENLLLHTNRAYDMADRGQIARSEVPVVGLLNSNTKDTDTREQALGMDIQNRRRYATPENKMEMLSPEQFTATLGKASADANPVVDTPTAPATQAVATAPAVQGTMLGTPTAPATEPTMTQADPMVGQGYTNLGVPTGQQPREFGYNEQSYSDIEAQQYARALGWDPKTSATTEKKVDEAGNEYERVISQSPFLQAGFDEGMGVNTPRLGYKDNIGDWQLTKAAKKATSDGTYVDKFTFNPSKLKGSLKEDVVDNFLTSSKIDRTVGNYEEIKAKVDEYQTLVKNRDKYAPGADLEDEDKYEMYETQIEETTDELKMMNPAFAAKDINASLDESSKNAIAQYPKSKVYGVPGDVNIKPYDVVSLSSSRGGKYKKQGALKAQQGRDLKENIYYKLPIITNDGMKKEIWIPEATVTEKTPRKIAQSIIENGYAFKANEHQTFLSNSKTNTNKKMTTKAKEAVDPTYKQLEDYFNSKELFGIDRDERLEMLDTKAESLGIKTGSKAYKDFKNNPETYSIKKEKEVLGNEINKNLNTISDTFTKYNKPTNISFETTNKDKKYDDMQFNLSSLGSSGAELILTKSGGKDKGKAINLGSIDGANLVDEEVMYRAILKKLKEADPDYKSIRVGTTVYK